METQQAIEDNKEEFSTSTQGLDNECLVFLNQIGLPNEKVLASADERRTATTNLMHVLDNVDRSFLYDAQYLSKFFIAIAAGLFDAALSYLWDETIKQLRARVINGDIKRFYDAIISDDRRKHFNNPEDILKLNDYELITGAMKINLISETGYKQLDHIRDMRNSMSAAHPSSTEITGLRLISWLELCIEEVIAKPPSQIPIDINELLRNIKFQEINKSQAETIVTSVAQLSKENAEALAKGCFGIYIDLVNSQQVRNNIDQLMPTIWKHISTEVKSNLGIRCANFITNGDNESASKASQFLERVGGLSYLPDSARIPKIKFAIENLIAAHDRLYNFDTEPRHATYLLNLVGLSGNVPPELNLMYVQAIVYVFLSKKGGIAWDAEPIYIRLIRMFDYEQSLIALKSFED